MRYLGLCCIVKDEDKFLKEWLAYHAAIGVEHFYLYDNESAAPLDEWLNNFASSAQVTILRAPGPVMQLPAYNHCLTNFGSQYKWLAFIDADEYLLPHETDDLRTFLAEFEPYGGLGVHWRMFSSSGHETSPDIPVIKAYDKAFTNPDSHIKSIIQPEKTTGCRNPHAFGYINGSGCVNEQHWPIAPGTALSAPSIERIQINHYYFKSHEDFTHKLQKGRIEGKVQNDTPRSIEYFEQHLHIPVGNDTRIQRFLPQVATTLENDSLGSVAGTDYVQKTSADLLSAAQTAIHQGDWYTAEILLCGLAMRVHDVAELWLMRAMAARLQKRLVAAEYFMNEALRLDSGPALWIEKFQITLEKEQYPLAATILEHLKKLLDMASEKNLSFAYRLEVMEKMLKFKGTYMKN